MAHQDPCFSRPEDFKDPLQNYDSKKYKNPIEQALAEETAVLIKHLPCASIRPDTTVAEAVKKLADFHIACLPVENEGKLVGVFSDRNVLDKVALEYDELKDRPVSDVMTPNPVYVYETDPSASVLSVMAVSGYRHVPILDLNDNLVGIASPQRVTQFLQNFFDEE